MTNPNKPSSPPGQDKPKPGDPDYVKPGNPNPGTPPGQDKPRPTHPIAEPGEESSR